MRGFIPSGTEIKVTVSARAGSGYKGTAVGTYRITQANISSAKVTISDMTYTGKPVTLDKSLINVQYKGQKLTTADFEIVGYTDNIKKGTAKVTIRGLGNYGGLKTQSFKIKAKGLKWWWRKN